MAGAFGETLGAVGGVTFTLTTRVPTGGLIRALPPRLAATLFDEWCPARHPSGAATAAVATLGVSLGGSLADDSAALRERVRLAVRDGRVVALRGGRGSVPGGVAPWEEAEERAPASASPREVKTWITIRMLDEDDPARPVPNVRYRIRLPDDTVREGTLNADGIAHFTGIDPGSCLLNFPDLDSETWERLD
jgi:hypothetical protein